MYFPPVISAYTLPQDQIVPVTQYILTTARVHTSTRLHALATSMDRCCLVAHSGDNVCLRIFLTHGLHFSAGTARHVGQWTVQCALRESLVHGLDAVLGNSNVEFQGQGAGEGERNTQDKVRRTAPAMMNEEVPFQSLTASQK